MFDILLDCMIPAYIVCPIQLGLSVGQDIDGHVMFPEDNYGEGEYQEDGPQPEDKV